MFSVPRHFATDFCVFALMCLCLCRLSLDLAGLLSRGVVQHGSGTGTGSAPAFSHSAWLLRASFPRPHLEAYFLGLFSLVFFILSIVILTLWSFMLQVCA